MESITESLCCIAEIGKHGKSTILQLKKKNTQKRSRVFVFFCFIFLLPYALKKNPYLMDEQFDLVNEAEWKGSCLQAFFFLITIKCT